MDDEIFKQPAGRGRGGQGGNRGSQKFWRGRGGGFNRFQGGGGGAGGGNPNVRTKRNVIFINIIQHFKFHF